MYAANGGVEKRGQGESCRIFGISLTPFSCSWGRLSRRCYFWLSNGKVYLPALCFNVKNKHWQPFIIIGGALFISQKSAWIHCSSIFKPYVACAWVNTLFVILIIRMLRFQYVALDHSWTWTKMAQSENCFTCTRPSFDSSQIYRKYIVKVVISYPVARCVAKLQM